MGIKVLSKILDIAKYIVFCLATITVFVYRFIPENVIITIALSIYVFAFALMFVASIVRCVEIFRAAKLARNSNTQEEVVVAGNGELKGQKVEVVNLTSEKVFAILGAIFFAIFTIFTLCVVILF